MNSQIKAIAAAAGGALAGAGGGAVVLPDGSPWYGYVLMTLITTVVPYLFTYFAPKNGA